MSPLLVLNPMKPTMMINIVCAAKRQEDKNYADELYFAPCPWMHGLFFFVWPVSNLNLDPEPQLILIRTTTMIILTHVHACTEFLY